jgi:hypothetical protein
MDAVKPKALPELFKEAVDDDRVYHSRFRATTSAFEPSADEIEKELEKEAKRIEETAGCVTTVVRVQRGAVGMRDESDVVLYALLPRHTDKELFERVVEESRHRMMNRLHSPDE